MLTQLVALPLLLATSLDAPALASTRSRTDVSAEAPGGDFRRDPAPSIESSPRPPEPGLRRVWSAVGCEPVDAGARPPLRGRVTTDSARATEDGRVRKSRTRGPPCRVC
jgi:hypothetical protein